MAEPTQVRPTEVPQDLTPPEKVIESLQAPPPRTPAQQDPMVVPPLRWDEVIPSSAEIKGILGKTAVWLGGLVVAVGLWFLAVQVISFEAGRRLPSERLQEMRDAPKVPEVAARPSARVRPPLTAIPMSLPAPAAPEAAIVSEPERPVPENLTARFFSPLMVELNWDSLGEAYRYRLYSAQTASMTDARLETGTFIVNPHFAWSPREDAAAVWLAVSSIDPEGRESPLSRPLYLRLR